MGFLGQIFPVLGISFLLVGSCIPQEWLLFQFQVAFRWSFYISWSVGVIIGGFFSALVSNCTRKLVYCATSGVFSIISGAIFHSYDEENLFLVALYLSGMAYGFLFVAAVIYAGEIADDRIRGALCGLIGIAQPIAIAIPSFVFPVEIDPSFDYETVVGTICVVFSMVGVLMFTAYKESPVLSLILKKKESAVRIMMEVRNTKDLEKLDVEFKGLNAIVDESESAFSKNHLWSLIRIVLIRLVYGLSVSNGISTIIYATAAKATEFNKIVITVWRVIFDVFTLFIIDYKANHKLMLVLSMVISGVFCTAVGGMLRSTGIDHFSPVLAYMLPLFILTIGTGLDVSSITYMSVAFPPLRKSWYIFSILVSEVLVNIINLHLHEPVDVTFVSSEYLALGISSILVGSLLVFVLPDITQLSLSNSYYKMKSCKL